MGESSEAIVLDSEYGGCRTFADERVVGRCAYEYWMCNMKDCSWDKIKDVI